MDQSKYYDRPGGYTGYTPGTPTVTVVDLLAQILTELKFHNEPARRRTEVVDRPVLQQVFERDKGTCRLCGRTLNPKDRRSMRAPRVLHFPKSQPGAYILVCAACRSRIFSEERSDAWIEKRLAESGGVGLGHDRPSQQRDSVRAGGEDGEGLGERDPSVGLDAGPTGAAEAAVAADEHVANSCCGIELAAAEGDKVEAEIDGFFGGNRDGEAAGDEVSDGAHAVSMPDEEQKAPEPSHDLVREVQLYGAALRDVRDLLLHQVNLTRFKMLADLVSHKVGDDGRLLFDMISVEDSAPEAPSDTTGPPVEDSVPEPPVAGLTHYSFYTAPGRPFFSRMLCDLACSRSGTSSATSDWAHVTCPECQDIGADTVITLNRMSDAALVSLGAAPASTGNEATR